MKDEGQEQRYECKFCSKICFSGRSLGGHMRIHLALISAKKDDNNTYMKSGGHSSNGFKKKIPNEVMGVSEQSNSTLGQEEEEIQFPNSSMYVDGGDGDQSGYGLRERPKKSWKISDSKHGDLKTTGRCKECGKVFQSVRALTGHMKCHSMKAKQECAVCKTCGKGFDSMRALFGHMRHHSAKRSRVSIESEKIKPDLKIVCPIGKKRSRIRYNITPSPTVSNLNTSITKIDEAEEAAICLLMISRGVTHWEGFASISDPIEIASPLTGAQSFHQIKGIAEDGFGNSLFDCDDVMRVIEKTKQELNSSVPDSDFLEKKILEFGEFDSKVAFDGGFMNNRPNYESATEIEGADIGKGIYLFEKVTETCEGDSRMAKPNSNVKAQISSHEDELQGKASDKVNCANSGSEIFKESEKKRDYKCKTCDKIFHSYQALGGHRNRHKTITFCSAINMESSEKCIQIATGSKLGSNCSSFGQEIGIVEVANYDSTRNKDHECPICLKVFPSGQALGGHKRAHYVGLYESREKKTMAVIKQEIPDINDILDLNVPATAVEEEDKVSFGLKPWWIGSDHNCEALFISN